MTHPSYWGVVEWSIVGFLLLYTLRGFFRPVAKSTLSLILLPVTLFAYVLVPIFMGYNVIFLDNLLGFIKLLVVSFIMVTLGRWLIYFVFGKILSSRADEEIFFAFFKRLPGAVLSGLEGVCLLIAIFWSMEFMDDIMSKRFPDAYQSLCRLSPYSWVNDVNPVYDIRGAKTIKCIMNVFSNPGLVDRLVNHPVYRNFDNLPTIRKIIANQEYQKLAKENDLKGILTNPLTFEFLRSRDVFLFLTSSEFSSACRSVMPPGQLKLIDERSGFLSDITLNFKSTRPNSRPLGDTKPFVSDTRVMLKNGSSVEGQVVSQDSSGILLLLPEGQMRIKKEEILNIQQIKN